MNQQNQTTVGNQPTPVPETSAMNDRDYMNELLATEKYITDSYCTALNEFSHDALYQDIHSIFNESKDAQRRLFNVMFQHGWYKVEAEKTQKLQQAYTQFQNTLQNQSPYQQH